MLCQVHSMYYIDLNVRSVRQTRTILKPTFLEVDEDGHQKQAHWYSTGIHDKTFQSFVCPHTRLRLPTFYCLTSDCIRTL